MRTPEKKRRKPATQRQEQSQITAVEKIPFSWMPQQTYFIFSLPGFIFNVGHYMRDAKKIKRQKCALSSETSENRLNTYCSQLKS